MGISSGPKGVPLDDFIFLVFNCFSSFNMIIEPQKIDRFVYPDPFGPLSSISQPYQHLAQTWLVVLLIIFVISIFVVDVCVLVLSHLLSLL